MGFSVPSAPRAQMCRERDAEPWIAGSSWAMQRPGGRSSQSLEICLSLLLDTEVGVGPRPMLLPYKGLQFPRKVPNRPPALTEAKSPNRLLIWVQACWCVPSGKENFPWSESHLISKCLGKCKEREECGQAPVPGGGGHPRRLFSV